MRIQSEILPFIVSLLAPSAIVHAELKPEETLQKVVAFYRGQVGYRGAYVWRYSADLTQQEGEGQAYPTTGWTQPPGTPAVGEAYLAAWRYCGEQSCLDAAVEAAHALEQTQLVSGGWDSRFELGKEHRKRYAYRVDGNKHGRRNHTTFDDNKSQSALMLLMHVDEALAFKDAKIHAAVAYALEKMLAAQYPNGAWPQQFSDLPDATKHLVKKATYPETWSRTFPKTDYRGYYTLNDNNMSHIIDMLFEAARIYDRKDCRAAAEKTGDFFLLAQMPEPQPGWAQQYDRDMHPAWARKFEPPAVTGGESMSVMRTLLSLYRHTGERRFLDPLPRAIAYYRQSQLPEGRFARFYELRTNKPLYFTKDYRLTYSDADMPTHYGFKVGSVKSLDSLNRELRLLQSSNWEAIRAVHKELHPRKMSDRLRRAGQQLIAALDGRGAWVEDGSLREQKSESDHVIEMRTFVRNLPMLAQFVGAR